MHHAELGGDFLQFAVLIAHAREALLRMIGEEKLDIRLSRISDPGGIRDDFDAIPYARRAGADEGFCTLHFHQTDAA